MEFIKDILLAETPWVMFKEKVFRGKSGSLKKWTYVERKMSHRAVCIIPITEDGQIGIISQPRPPAAKIVWEFPAGLVDDNESLEAAALRELKEETGANGIVLSVSPQVYSTPGLANETISYVEVLVKSIGESKPEVDEEIELIWMDKFVMFDFLRNQIDKGDGVDAKLWLYAQLNRPSDHGE